MSSGSKEEQETSTRSGYTGAARTGRVSLRGIGERLGSDK